jgi:hypothetical protein
MNERWEIRHVQYLPYAEVLTLGGGDLETGMDRTRPEVVARNLTYQQARRMVEELGFGYSMHPAQ